MYIKVFECYNKVLLFKFKLKIKIYIKVQKYENSYYLINFDINLKEYENPCNVCKYNVCVYICCRNGLSVLFIYTCIKKNVIN